jgi:uncharacterized protein
MRPVNIVLSRRGLAVLALVAATGGCHHEEAKPRSEATVVRLASGRPGGGFYALGDAIQRLTALNRDIRIQYQVTGGAIANLQAIQTGTTDVGFAFADVAYLAYVGRLDGSAPLDQLRAIAVLQLTPVQLVARPHSDIRTVADLRGRRVALGPVGSGTALTARLILGAFGIEPASVHTESLEFRNAGDHLVDGTLDAMFDNAIKAEATALVLRAGGHLVPIEGRRVDRLRLEYPFLRMTIIPRETYGSDQATPTIGVDSLLLCRRDLDSNIVHAFTAALFESMPSLSSANGAFAELDQASTAPIPLHDGASRYYREQELLR